MNDMGGNASGDRRQCRHPPPPEAMGNTGRERGQYNRVDPLFLTERLDFLNYFELTLQCGLRRSTALGFSLARVEQRSNIHIYASHCTERWLTLLYEIPKQFGLYSTTAVLNF
jgi:hypothetical protein